MDWKDYGQLTAAGNSLRKQYGLQTYHDSDQDMDAWLSAHSFSCVIAILIDAMGISVMQKHLDPHGFFRSHTIKEMTTVFPPTTSAATTSFRTGKSPAENGWLGWNQYFRELDDNMILFRSQSQYTDVIYPDFIKETIPYTDLVQDLQAEGITSASIWPAWSPVHPSRTYPELLNNARKQAVDEHARFVYAYWDALDTLMHQAGPSSAQAGELLRQIEAETESFAETLPEDIGVVIVADHSQIDIHQKDLEAEKEICACFEHEPALEPRTIAFYIKKEKRDEFTARFQQTFGHDYHLYTKAEVLAGKFFGEGVPFARYEEFIGDYLAVGKSDLQLYYKKGKGKKGDHAGGLKEEALIPLILYTKQ